jgi:predicted component of type VI protein secretion system
MILSLEVLTEGKQKGKRLPITLPQFLIGRDAQCHLRPASPLISKRHCAILQRDDKVFVRDFDSTNGTFVNEVPVKGEVELKNEDHLKIGPIAFNVWVDADAVLNRPAPPGKVEDATKIPNKGAALAKKGPAKPAAKATVAEAGSDDDVAAMLLSLQDDETGATPYVPEGSTVFDMPMPAEGTERPKSDADKEKEKAKQHQGNTSSAAKSILEKMMRRPRT